MDSVQECTFFSLDDIRLYNESNYKLDNYTDEKRQPLTSEYLESKFDGYYTRIVAFDGGREGEVVINKDFEEFLHICQFPEPRCPE